MANPFVKLKSSGEIICDDIPSYSYWRMPRGKVTITPISGGAYPQNTSAGTLRITMTLRFTKDSATSPLDNYFYLDELERANAQEVYRVRDLQGFTRDAHIANNPFGDDGESGSASQSIRDDRIQTYDMISIEVEFVVPGYLPAELGP